MAQTPHLKATRKDYWKIGPVYVLKWIVLLLLAAGAVAVLAAFGLPSFPPLGTDPPAYRWDDVKLGKITGRVRVLDSSGVKRYEGTVAAGAYTGHGKVYDSAGALVYDGPLVDGVYSGEGAKVYQDGQLVYTGEMALNLYEGQGRRIDLDSGVVSEGQFSRGCLGGDCRDYDRTGGLLREGVFSHDLLNGEGREYDGQGVLLREGTFSQGLLHGQGMQYTSAGQLWYEGQFQRGVWCGQGKLYDSVSGVLAYTGEFSGGKAMGQGRIYHPSGQLLYEGTVYDGRPRADAFLGLSLAEVEGSFAEHWLMYTGDGMTAFVYPYFHLMFVTDIPIKLTTDTQEAAFPFMFPESSAAAFASDFLVPAEGSDPAASDASDSLTPAEVSDPLAALPSDPPNPTAASDAPDRALDPDTAKEDLVIREVLSYGDPLPGTPQPQPDQPGALHLYGWREWFSACALGLKLKGAQAEQTGPFVWEFTPVEGEPQMVEEHTARGNGILVTAVWNEGKENPLFYESAVREDGP